MDLDINIVTIVEADGRSDRDISLANESTTLVGLALLLMLVGVFANLSGGCRSRGRCGCGLSSRREMSQLRG